MLPLLFSIVIGRPKLYDNEQLYPERVLTDVAQREVRKTMYVLVAKWRAL